METPNLPAAPMLTINWDEIDKDLTPNQSEALRFVAAGFGNTVASKSIGLERSAISRWLKNSMQFLAAYERVRAEVRRYNEAMLEYTATTAWLRIQQYMFDPEKLLAEDDKKIPATLKRALIAEQGRMLRHVTGGLRAQQINVEHTATPALLAATEQAAGILAKRIVEVEGHFIDAAPDDVFDSEAAKYRAILESGSKTSTVHGMAVDWAHQKLKCPLCPKWYKDLYRHFTRDHGKTSEEVREECGLSPEAPLRFDLAVRKPIDEN